MSNDNKYSLSRRKALLGLGTVGVAGAGAGVGTSALFSDNESFDSNTITAGTQNLLVDAGIVDDSTFDGNAGEINIADTTADGTPAAGITVTDLKPGDSFVIGINPRVTGNPGYLALSASVDSDTDATNTEPEVDADGDLASTSDSGNGELAENLEITALGYKADGNPNDGIPGSLASSPPSNQPFTFDAGSSTLTPQTLSSLASGNGILYRGRGGTNNPPAGHGGGTASPTRVGGNSGANNVDTSQVTHLVEFTLPTSVGNVVQGDSLTFSLTWSLEQVRNNSPPANASQVEDGNAN